MYFIRIRYPALGFKRWAFHDFICRVIFHYVPALIADFVLTLLRKKCFMLKISLKVCRFKRQQLTCASALTHEGPAIIKYIFDSRSPSRHKHSFFIYQVSFKGIIP